MNTRRLTRTMAALAAVTLLSADTPAVRDTLGLSPPEGAITLFDGKDLSGWTTRGGKPAEWPVTDGIFTVGPGKGDIRTKEEFGDFDLHLEFNVPYMPQARGQGRGNSGVYLIGRYELQVLDSYGLDSKDNDCGGIYRQFAPAVNACKPPLQWQTYDITFRAPKVVDGRVVEKARITVRHNGQIIHDNRAIDPTPGGIDQDPAATRGPILLQDHGNDVQYRNIWLKPRA